MATIMGVKMPSTLVILSKSKKAMATTSREQNSARQAEYSAFSN